MLGRLHMSIEECIDSYGDFMARIFTNEHGKIGTAANLVFRGAKYGSEDLEEVIKGIVQEQLHDANATLLSDRRDEKCRKECKVQVIYIQRKLAAANKPDS